MIKYEKLLNTEGKKANFADTFLKKYLEYGFTTLNKGDLQDLILYALNEASEVDFLSENTNYEISNFLKTTEAKIKSSMINIEQKFSTYEENKNILRLLKKMKSEKIKLEYDNQNVSFILENTVEKRDLEAKLKEIGFGADYKNNKEIVVISVGAFVELIAELKNNYENVYAPIEKAISKKVNAEKKEDRIKNLISIAGEITKDILVSVISTVISNKI